MSQYWKNLKILENESMRTYLKRVDDIETPMSGEYYNKLHDKIMSAVESSQIKPAPKLQVAKNLLRAHWRGW